MPDCGDKLWKDVHSNHRMLWTNRPAPAGWLWITCIFPEKSIAKKALKIRLFFDMIGTLQEKVIHKRAEPFHTLWKVLWISTGYPQGYVEEMWTDEE